MSPSDDAYVIPDEWCVRVEGHEDDKVECNSGTFIKGTWRFVKDLNRPFVLLARRDPSAEMSSQCSIKENKGLQFKWSFTLWSEQRGES